MSYDILQRITTYNVYEVFKALVELVQADALTLELIQDSEGNVKPIAYYCGYWNGIQTELSTGGRATKLTEVDKFPLIFVHAKFDQKKGEAFDILAEVNPKIYIIDRTKTTYKFQDKIDYVFVESLDPIQDLLIEKLQSSGYFKLDGKGKRYPLIEFTRQDLHFDNSDEADQNQLNDYVEAIELSFSKLQVYNNLNLS